MTIIVGFIGTDGAVMASDSQATEADDTRFNVADKIWKANDVLFGYSGYVAVGYQIRTAVRAALKNRLPNGGTYFEHQTVLQESIRPCLKHAYANFVSAQPGQTAGNTIAGALLVMGRETDSYWMMEVDLNCIASPYTDRAFHAIGSGSIPAQMARGLLESYEPKESPRLHLELMAFRTIRTCIQVSAYGVGGNIHIWSSTDGGPFTKLGQVDLERLSAREAVWRETERESLARSLGEEEVEVDVPGPLNGGR